jgi:hypothetical protein
MNVEIGTEAAQFPEKEYTKGIFIAVRDRKYLFISSNLKSQSAVLNWILNLNLVSEVRLRDITCIMLKFLLTKDVKIYEVLVCTDLYLQYVILENIQSVRKQ